MTSLKTWLSLWCLFLFCNAGLARSFDFVLHDDARKRDVPVRVYLPTTPGPHPVILFSHGLGGSREGYEYLGSAWASHGYVSIHPTHEGSDHSLVKRWRPLKSLRDLKKAVNEENTRARAEDIRFLLDSFAKLESQLPLGKGSLDAKHVGVAGHSFGSFTSLIVAGMKVHAPDGTTPKLSDDRPIAFIALSPQGLRDGKNKVLDEHSWEGLSRPVLEMTGSKDEIFGTTVKDRLDSYERLPAGDKFLVFFDGADHFTFAGRGKRATPERLRCIVDSTLAFWDRYLKANAGEGKRLKEAKIDSCVKVATIRSK